MVTYELYGIVRSKGKKIAVGDNGIFATNNEKIIKKLDELGFKRIIKTDLSKTQEENNIEKPKHPEKKNTKKKRTSKVKT